MDYTRRGILYSGAAIGPVSLAGCSDTSSSNDDEDDAYGNSADYSVGVWEGPAACLEDDDVSGEGWFHTVVSDDDAIVTFDISIAHDYGRTIEHGFEEDGRGSYSLDFVTVSGWEGEDEEELGDEDCSIVRRVRGVIRIPGGTDLIEVSYDESEAILLDQLVTQPIIHEVAEPLEN